MTAKTTDINTNSTYSIVIQGLNKKQYESTLSALKRLQKGGFLADHLEISGTSNSASIYKGTSTFKGTSNIYNNTSIIDNNKRNNSLKSKTATQNSLEIATKALDHFIALFPSKFKPNTNTKRGKWLDILEKIQRIDGYDLGEVYQVCKKLRTDSFWNENFLSILKLRTSDKNGVLYIHRFMTRNSLKSRPKGFYKVSKVVKYFVYFENEKQLLGAKTKNGELNDYNLRQLLTNEEYEELLKYAK